ncbi:MAG TPA: TonB-dependent receptor, partial [Opitutaceae bacterium]
VDSVEIGTVGPGLDNGYNGEYSGLRLLSRANLGTATVQGWEFSYQQQFTFLPGLLRGLGLSANLTVLDTRGDFGGASVRRTGEVPGFIPRAANVILSWRHRGFGARIVGNRVGDYISAFTEASPGRNQYVRSRTVVNAGLAYQWRPSVSFAVDVQNIFNAPQQFYRGIPDQMSEYRIPGTTITFSVSGRF